MESSLAACVVLALSAVPAAAQQARFVPLGFVGSGDWSTAVALDADGTVVVGRADNPDPAHAPHEAVRWAVANHVDVILNPIVDSGTTLADGVDASGFRVFGEIFEPEYSSLFLWDPAGTWLEFGYGSAFVSLAGANRDGSLLAITATDLYGGSEALVGFPGVGWQSLGVLPGGFYANARGMSADGLVVVGDSSSTEGQQAFRWTDATGMQALGFLPSSTGPSIAVDCDAHGEVVVGRCMVAGKWETFRWTAATGMVGLGFLPGATSSLPSGVSDDGDVIVGHSDGIPFVWTPALGMVSLRERLTAQGAGCLDGWTLSTVNDVSADGNGFCGEATNPSGQKEAFVAYLDAPAKLTLGERRCSPGAPNSTGDPARLSVRGSTCVDDAALTLVLDDLPGGAWGELLAASEPAYRRNPFGGEGFLCLGAGLVRVSTGGFVANAAGHAEHALDFGQTPIVAGTTWIFQAYYRDADPGPTSNFSDAVVVAFR